MGTIKSPPPVQFFTSIIFRDSGILSQAEAGLSGLLGALDEKTAVVPFCQSDYYEPEMGTELMRCFLLFQPLLDRERLAEIKGATNRIEERLSTDGRRLVNIDPGYVALEHMVLATTKGYSHRLYLGQGIFADLTLIYDNGTYRPLPWTYPDYGSDELISLFNLWRERYKRLLRWRRA